MAIRVGINGFGRIGRQVVRAFNIVPQSLGSHLARHHFALFSGNRRVQQNHSLFQTGETRPRITHGYFSHRKFGREIADPPFQFS